MLAEAEYSNLHTDSNGAHDLGVQSYNRNDCGSPLCYRNSTHFHCGTCDYGTSQVTNVIAHRRVCGGTPDIQLQSESNLFQHEILQSSSPFPYYPAVTPNTPVGLSPHAGSPGSSTSKIITTQQSTMFNFMIPSQSPQYGTLYGTQSVFPNSNLFSPSGFNSFSQLESTWLSQTRIIPAGVGVHTPNTVSPTSEALPNCRGHCEKIDSSNSPNCFSKIGGIENATVGMCSPLTAEALKVVSKELQRKIDSPNWCCSTQSKVGFGVQNGQQSSCRYSDATQCSVSLLFLEQNDFKQAEECVTVDDFNFETTKNDEKMSSKENSVQCFSSCLELSKENGQDKEMAPTETRDDSLPVDNLLNRRSDENIDLESLTVSSEESNIVVEESETEAIDSRLLEDLKLRCLVCNKSAPLLSVNNFISLSEEMPLTTTTHVSILSKLSQVIDDEKFNKLKDCSICPRCLNLINVVDRLEIKLKSAKDELIDMYRSKEKVECENESSGVDESAKGEGSFREDESTRSDESARLDAGAEFDGDAVSDKLCHICNKTFSSSHYLEKHKQCHTKVYSYYCEYCGKGFATLTKLENHLLLHSNSSRFQCELCGKQYGHKHSLVDHIRKHKGEYSYRCGVCGKGFVRKSVYKVHLQNHSGESLVCHCCGRQFKGSANLLVHVRKCSGDLKFGCDKCEKKFPLKSLLEKHISVIHDSKYDFVCSICKKGFGKNSDLKSHLRSHSDSKPFNCSKCDRSYKSLSSLNHHMKVHSVTKVLECSVCQRQFTRKDSLHDHMNMHTGNRPYECEVCGLTFASRINFKLHGKRHTGKRTETPCPVCGKMFAKGLKDHMVTHSGERPFACEFCTARFTVKSSLTKHIRTVHKAQGNEM